MPAGDRTGPAGVGPRSGRASGYCSGFDAPGYARSGGRGSGRGTGCGRGMGYGRGMGAGRGFRAGRGNGAGYPFTPFPYGAPAMSREDEVRMLKSQVESLELSKKEIERRLEELNRQ